MQPHLFTGANVAVTPNSLFRMILVDYHPLQIDEVGGGRLTIKPKIFNLKKDLFFIAPDGNSFINVIDVSTTEADKRRASTLRLTPGFSTQG